MEPVHGSSYVPIWAYTNEYILRSGHTWIGICSLKSVLDTHIKPSNPERYASTEIWSDAPAPDATPTQDPAVMQSRMEQRRLLDVLSNPILAQIGAALAAPYPEDDVPSFLLCGHSHTGGVVINYIRGGHDVYRQDDRSPVYQGFLPTGSAGVSPGESSSVTLGPCDVPILQVLSEGDISNPNRFGDDGRAYRRPDSDDPADRYRLYEIAGIAHIDTRYPPGNDASFWRAASGFGANAGDVPEDAHMNSLPHHRLFSMALDQLAKWVGDGTTPPRADRIDVGPDGLFVKDECGNSRGGVRCVQLDVPKATYFANPGVGDDGLPARGSLASRSRCRRRSSRASTAIMRTTSNASTVVSTSSSTRAGCFPRMPTRCVPKPRRQTFLDIWSIPLRRAGRLGTRPLHLLTMDASVSKPTVIGPVTGGSGEPTVVSVDDRPGGHRVHGRGILRRG